jgi:acetyl-CoA carboxylase alpha subunit
MRTLLDFEKPIAELEAKLAEMKKLAIDNNVDVSTAAAQLKLALKNSKRNFLKLDTLAKSSAVSSPRTSIYTRLHRAHV